MKAYYYYLLPILFCCISCSGPQKEAADLILFNGEIYTMEEAQPWATAIVIKENKIVAVLDKAADPAAYQGKETQMIDLQGKFALPGFIDGHTHFNRAGELINDANLLKVSDDPGLKAEIGRVVNILEKGEWITGGLWGAYEQWADASATASGAKKQAWKPHKGVIDEISAEHPVFINNYNRQLYLANSMALQAAGLEAEILEGMETDEEGRATGLVYANSPAFKKIKESIKEKSSRRLLDENKAALKVLRESGIVEIHDITRPDQTERFQELYESGELTARIWMRPDLARAQEMKDAGMSMGVNPASKKEDTYLRYGAFKGYIDGIMGNHGALFFEPYDDQPDNYGHYRHHTSDDEDYATPNMEKMYGYLLTAQEAGFVANVHAIGTRGVSLMLDTYERLMKDLGKDLSGYRVIHAQVIRPDDFPRFKELNVIAEINPYHLSDDMRWMEERIGHERCKGAYAFKSLLDNGASLSFGSDWPGTMAAYYHVHPKYLIHAAVNRTTTSGQPEGGWFPEQKISMEEALKAYTINNAKAAFDGDSRGSIKAGKLADIVVCDKNLMKIDPAEILDMEVEMTIVDGKIVFERNQ
ncbi:MAG: amidohydrolase [Bacteroidia bacterium]|nr:amidohydrolase [Bacteroidia bacterium]